MLDDIINNIDTTASRDFLDVYASGEDLLGQHHFDTYRLLLDLEHQGFTRSQAEVVMKGIKFKLRESAAILRQRLLLRSDLENEAYLFKAALSELRTEIQIMRRNDTQLLQTEASLITREVENLAQKLREDVATMKNEVMLDMNNRKNETREEQKVIDMRIQEINNKLTVLLGDVRTGIEAVRWETIWKGMTGVAAAGLTIATLGYLLTRYADRRAEALAIEKQKKLKQLQEEARHAGTLDMELPPSRESRTHYVQSFVESQRGVLELEVELQCRRRAEIRSYVPLDTRHIDEEVIQDDSTVLCAPPVPAPTPGQAEIMNTPEETNQITPGTPPEPLPIADSPAPKSTKSKRKWLFRALSRWIHNGNNKVERREEESQVSAETTATPTPVQQIEATTTTTTEIPRSHNPIDTNKVARHTSWSAGTTFEQYKKEKAAIIRRGLCGLSNANIARALGSEQKSLTSMLFLPTPSPDASAVSDDRSPSSPAVPKRDSGISFFAALTSPSKPTHSPAITDSSSVSSVHGRRLSVSSTRHHRGSLRFSPRLSILREEDDDFIAFRYPKMVRMQALRDAAIQVLSSDMTFSPDNSCDENDDMFRSCSKRYSDPGLGLPVPPFPIGKPLPTIRDWVPQ
ncbi:hypothetical protein DFQ28_007657 [Apophysomyces sp. BC1034]|nr:hypothetical protein DFQ30_007522 [Apophysomyces sp. BC1015]KAG0176154.1 hypothetical protein DFQ29_006491 [Apophysomyces sp. BC1021]KAG0186526.1 hypothetical protein DFQ28_007657 [Apophysomyces sp. BC1034]